MLFSQAPASIGAGSSQETEGSLFPMSVRTLSRQLVSIESTVEDHKSLRELIKERNTGPTVGRLQAEH